MFEICIVAHLEPLTFTMECVLVKPEFVHNSQQLKQNLHTQFNSMTVSNQLLYAINFVHVIRVRKMQ